MRFAGRLAYDGTDFYGFQRQPAHTPTVQGELEAALEHITQQHITVHGAGRTDTGVHASGQVIAFDLDWQHETDALLRAINANLPNAIALQTLETVAQQFHPRFDALSRTYIYKLYLASTRDPLRERFAWHQARTLDVETMQTALGYLLGEHDFATFGQPTQGDSTTRRLDHVVVEVVLDEIHVTLTANAFLRRMVRSIVGTLVDVGRGFMTLADFEAAFRAAERSLAGTSAPPQGLTLVHVAYPDR